MATKDATLNNFKAFYKEIQPYLSGGAPAYADALTVNEFLLNSTAWESTTDFGYSYKYFIETDAYRDDSIPTWHILSADGSDSVATKQEITEGQKIVSCIVNSTGVTLYAVALPNCNLTLFLKGGTVITGGSAIIDYSTDEQVVGTWIDGKPIYQKTYTGLSFEARTSWTDLGIDATNLIPHACIGYAGGTDNFASPLNIRNNSNSWYVMAAAATRMNVFETITVQYRKTTD